MHARDALRSKSRSRKLQRRLRRENQEVPAADFRSVTSPHVRARAHTHARARARTGDGAKRACAENFFTHSKRSAWSFFGARMDPKGSLNWQFRSCAHTQSPGTAPSPTKYTHKRVRSSMKISGLHRKTHTTATSFSEHFRFAAPSAGGRDLTCEMTHIHARTHAHAHASDTTVN
jgi:hypothetical protein